MCSIGQLDIGAERDATPKDGGIFNNVPDPGCVHKHGLRSHDVCADAQRNVLLEGMHIQDLGCQCLADLVHSAQVGVAWWLKMCASDGPLLCANNQLRGKAVN